MRRGQADADKPTTGCTIKAHNQHAFLNDSGRRGPPTGSARVWTFPFTFQNVGAPVYSQRIQVSHLKRQWKTEPLDSSRDVTAVTRRTPSTRPQIGP